MYAPERRPNKGIDWLLVLLAGLLMAIGFFTVYATTFEEGQHGFLAPGATHTKHLLRIGISIVVVSCILIIDSKFYTISAFPIYGLFMVLLAAVFVFGKTVRGDTNWLALGPLMIQPSEFAKFATALALAKLMSRLHFDMRRLRWQLPAVAIIALPALMVLLQGDEGSAIVFLSFLLVLYRFGLPSYYLWSVLLLVLLFILSLLMDQHVLLLLLLTVAGLIIYLVRKQRTLVFLTFAGLLLSVGIVYFAYGYVFNQVLEPHQQDRLLLLLGKQVQTPGADYNVRQSLIAIGSGGFWGKGYLNGTLTRHKFVPEQETDFIFCTIGEEFGFWGSSGLLLLFLAIILRILWVAQRQRSRFSMLYGYCVASVLFFHVLINVGMTIGLMPVIGIPLPLISYGGSSLLSFSILLFILIKLDADRLSILR